MKENTGNATIQKPSFTERLDRRGSARNSGIDLLRLLSMFFVVAVHTLSKGWGGLLEAAQPGTTQYLLAALLQAVTITSVDLFALISGYVGYSDQKKAVRITPLLQLYLQVVACGLFAAAVFLVLRPELVSRKDFLTPFIPITSDLYWYYTAYVGLFLVMPLLNAGLRHTPKRTLRVVFAAMFAAFSIYTCVVDRFKLEAGYTTIWLILLYIMGGILKKCEIGRALRPWMIAAGIAVLTGTAWIWKLYGPEVSLLGIGTKREMLVGYTSPTTLGASVLYVIGFSRLRCGRHLKRFATFTAPCVFAAYLLNANALVHDHLIEGRFAHLATASPLVLVGTVFGFAAAFVAASILLDRVRILLFDLLRVPQALASIDRTVHKLVEKYIPND